MKKALILEPKNPNKSTKLFGGRTSGILNWNDLHYPQLHKTRTKIRDNFYNASKYEIRVLDDISSIEEKMMLLLKNIQKSIDLISYVEGYSTDPSVVSIMATIADQSYEHIRSLYRIYLPEFDFVKIEFDKVSLEEALDEIIKIKKDKCIIMQEIVNLYSEKIFGFNKISNQITTDFKNHLDFIEELSKLHSSEKLKGANNIE